MFLQVSVCLFTGGGPHMTITHDTLDLTVQSTMASALAPLQTWETPAMALAPTPDMGTPPCSPGQPPETDIR